MSKAFIKEGDGREDDDEIPEPKIPSGTKNYITPEGAEKLRNELHELLHVKRPELTKVIAWAASNGDRSENADYTYGKRRLREMDKRIRFLEKRIENFEIINPVNVKSDRVLFGATVTIEDEDGEKKTYSIVGIDESDASKNKISWISPIATALLKAQKGDVVTFKSPKGIRELETISVRYVPIN